MHAAIAAAIDDLPVPFRPSRSTRVFDGIAPGISQSIPVALRVQRIRFLDVHGNTGGNGWWGELLRRAIKCLLENGTNIAVL